MKIEGYWTDIGGFVQKVNKDDAVKFVEDAAVFNSPITWKEDKDRMWACQIGSDGNQRHIGTIYKQPTQ